jgi:hypothetical protein
MAFPRATEIAHLLVKERLRPGDHAVDATVGNGHDTLFLATCVGAAGLVDGFDIQEAAIANARERIGDCPPVSLHLCGHEEMETVVPPGVMVVMFNLGYFPSGDKTVITRPDTTLIALSISLKLLAVGGLLTIVIYPGHPGGADEAKQVGKWVNTLDPDHFRAIHYGPAETVTRVPSPYLIAVERTV